MKVGDGVIDEKIGLLIGRAFEPHAGVSPSLWMRGWDCPRPNPLIMIPVTSLIGAALAVITLGAVSTGISRVPAAGVAVERAPPAPLEISEPGDPVSSAE